MNETGRTGEPPPASEKSSEELVEPDDMDHYTCDDEAEFDVESEQWDPSFHRPRSPRIPRRWDNS